jgi:tetratricopeptide (TPR) repeat protein
MARPASPRSPLVPVLTLLVGLCLGWATNPFGGAPAEAAAPLRAPAPAANADLPRASALDALDEGADPARVQAQATQPATASALEAAPEASGAPAPQGLLAELALLLRSGRIESALAHDAQGLLRFAIEAWLTAGEPREALALLQRHPQIESHQYARVGYALLNTEDREGAALAFLAHLERAGPESFDEDDLRRLGEIDPAAALAFLDSRAATTDEFLAAQVLPQRAVLLARAGRLEESLTLLRRLAATGALDEQALAALDDVAPEQAEAFLREVAPGDAQGASTLALARLLGGGERSAEAVELVRALLARRPEDTAALATLFALDPSASLEFLAGAQRELPPSLWTQAGHALQAQGRTSEAVDAWLKAFEGDPSDWESGGALVEHAPHILWPHTERMAADTRDDELLGDIADLNWRAGRRERALELWRRARVIDPGDGEWSNKLHAVALGEDPL